MKPKADIYADWGNEYIDPKLDVLINDLLDGKFDRDVYTIKKVKHVHSDKKQKKQKDDFVEPSKKKQRTHRGNETDANKDDVRSKSTHDTESEASVSFLLNILRLKPIVVKVNNMIFYVGCEQVKHTHQVNHTHH